MYSENDPNDLKNVGLKATFPRLKILDIFRKSGARHLSAEDVYRALIGESIDIGLATVYRVLTQFETAGLVMRHHFEGGHSVFEMSSDHHHDHIVCTKCGKVEEFMDAMIAERQQIVAKEMGFTVSDHSLYIYGLCKDCR